MSDQGSDLPDVTQRLEADIPRSGVTITEFMAKHGIEGGVRLQKDDTPSSAASGILTDEKGRRYEVGKIVAKGGMGAILAARDLNIRRTVAMKVMLKPKDATEQKALRFIEEAQVTGQLEHPSIVPVYELGVDAGENVFYTMKFVQGVTLKDILAGLAEHNEDVIRQYPLSRLLTVFQKVCDAMAYAHAKGVIHRDLKPENIMVGDYGEVLVMDWGLAKVLGGMEHGARSAEQQAGSERADASDGADRSTASSPVATAAGVPASGVGGGLGAAHSRGRTRGGLGGSLDAPRQGSGDSVPSIDSVRGDADIGEVLKTLDGQVMGTPQFMAPEQALGKVEDIGPCSDIYALGGILYNILALRPAVSGRNIGQLLLKVVKGDIVPPAALDADSALAERRAAKRAAQPAAGKDAVAKRAAASLDKARAGVAESAPLAFPHCPGGRIPPALSAVTMKAMALEPDDRYPRVKDLQADLDAYQGGFATGAEAAGALTQLVLLMKRHKTEVALIAAGVAILLAVVAGFVVKVNAEKNAAEAARQEAVAAKDAAEASAAEARAAREAQVALGRQAAPEFVVKAQRLMDQKDWDGAVDAATTAVGLDESAVEAWFLKGLLELGGRHFEPAQVAFERARKLAAPTSDEYAKSARYEKLAGKCAEIARRAGRDEGRVSGVAGQKTPGARSAAADVEHPASGSAGAPASPSTGSGPGGSRAPGPLVSDEDLAYALARALEKEDELLVSARLYKESGRARRDDGSDGMSLEMKAALRGLEVANPGLKAEQLDVVEDANPKKSGPPEGGTTNLGANGARLVVPPSGGPGGDARGRFACHSDALIDITPLAGTPVTVLDLSLTQVRDLAPLKGLPLRELNLARTLVTDLAPLQGMPLALLDLHGTNVADLAPLTGMPLEDLNLAGTKVRNLSPLERETPSSKSGPPEGGTTNLDTNPDADKARLVVPPSGGPGLGRLRLSNTAVADLTPLKGQPIEELYLDGTAVADLAPLAGLPLKVLDIADTKVTDLTPLAGLKLESLRYTPANIAKGHDLAQSMPCAKAIPGRPWTIPDLGMQFVPITPGKFQREGGGAVTLTKPFWLGRFEVTQAEYQAVMGSNPSAYKGERLPVETVSWHDAVAFCAKLTDRERASGRLEPGAEYRLPTEAEWEYCCRAGTTTTFHFGKDVSVLWKYANYRDKSSGLPVGKDEWEKTDLEHDDGYQKTAPVGSFEPNAWGLYDMTGNVYEWCGDWHGEYPAAEVTDPTGPASGSLRVYRGGCWLYGAVYCRSAYRYWYAPVARWYSLGFRLLRTAP